MCSEKEKEKEKDTDLTTFRAVFALEVGGGKIEIKAKNKQGAWEILKKIEPKAFLMIKSFEEIGCC